MDRRGPDHAAAYRASVGEGWHVDLLYTRLSIIDIDPRANQPVRSGRKRMVFNGELYNYVELRRTLEGLGCRFDTDSDTEVLLRAVDALGWPALDRSEGMWAFALFDEADGSLTLCRDRFGEKPLYMLRDGADLYFGSEVKFITELRGQQPTVDLPQIRRYLVNGYKSLYKTGATFFRDVEEVAPGTALRVRPDGEERWRYWQPRLDVEPDMAYSDAVQGAREHLLRAVELRLRADVPLAFCMSGGVDSNSLIAIARRHFGYDVHGFTILTTDPRYEERELVAKAVADLGIRHTSVDLSTDHFLPKLRTLVRQHDAPVYTISHGYVHWLLMEAVAAAGYRVAVSGTGADELFSGYFDHHLFYLREIWGDTELRATSIRSWEEHVRPIVRNPFLQQADRFVREPDFRDHIYLDAPRFAGFLTQPWMEDFAERSFVEAPLRNRMLNELFHEAVPVILHEDDLNAMYYSVENRSPFLDRRLMEFAYGIPTRHLIQDGRAKAVLRDAVRGLVPEEIRTSRRKVGFNAPILDLLDVRDPTVRAELLAEGPIYEHVRRSAITELLEKRNLPNSESKFLFNFVNAKIFLEEFGA